MRLAYIGLCVAVLSTSVFADVLLDHMDMVYYESWTSAVGNAIGGENFFGHGKRVAAEIANDFHTTSTAYIVSQVEVASVFYNDATDIKDVRVSIYPDSFGVPGDEPIYSARFSDVSERSPALAPLIRNTAFEDGYDELYGVWTIVSGLHIVLEPEKSYFICVQVFSGPDDFGYTLIDDVLQGADSFFRDGPPEEDECHCGWGFTDWRSRHQLFGRSGDAAYRVVASGGSEPSPKPGPQKSVKPADTGQSGHAPRPPAHPGRRGRKDSDEATHPADP